VPSGRRAILEQEDVNKRGFDLELRSLGASEILVSRLMLNGCDKVV
jgi:hypothetical protein